MCIGYVLIFMFMCCFVPTFLQGKMCHTFREENTNHKNVSFFIFSPHNPCFKSLACSRASGRSMTSTAHLVFTHGHHTDLIWSCLKFLCVHRCYGSKWYYGLLLINCRDIKINKISYLKKGGDGKYNWASSTKNKNKLKLSQQIQCNPRHILLYTSSKLKGTLKII